MAERIFLHVATPKSGTSYLQALLWQNVDLLRRRNLLLPETSETHYGAAKPAATSLVQSGAASITDILDLLDRIRRASLGESPRSGGSPHPPPTDGRSPLSPGPT